MLLKPHQLLKPAKVELMDWPDVCKTKGVLRPWYLSRLYELQKPHCDLYQNFHLNKMSLRSQIMQFDNIDMKPQQREDIGG